MRRNYDGVPVIADRAVVLVGCILLVVAGTAGTVLLAESEDSGPAYQPLACTYKAGR